MRVNSLCFQFIFLLHRLPVAQLSRSVGASAARLVQPPDADPDPDFLDTVARHRVRLDHRPSEIVTLPNEADAHRALGGRRRVGGGVAFFIWMRCKQALLISCAGSGL